MTINNRARNEITDILESLEWPPLDEDPTHEDMSNIYAQFAVIRAQIKADAQAEMRDTLEWLAALAVILALAIIVGTFVWLMW